MNHESETDVSIIDALLSVDGNLCTRGCLVVKGQVRGTVEGESIIIAREGRVFADVKVGRMTIGGHFEGTVVATQLLVILATGNCTGKVSCKHFMVEAGGVLSADITKLS